MPKPSKSSASSATRKKHSNRKIVAPPQDLTAGAHKSKSKPSKKDIKKGLAQPPKKSYIPPSKLKPPPVDIDPLHGIAELLPRQLVVVFRGLGKKDGITKGRALEELAGWVDRAGKQNREAETNSGEAEADVGMLVTTLPVWFHRYPALSIHPSRRIRHLTAQLHTSLLEVPTLRSNILDFLRITASEAQVSQILGTWCLSAWDVDRRVADLGSRSLKEVVDVRSGRDEPMTSVDDDKRLILDDLILSQSVLPFVLTTIMDPAATYTTLNPSLAALLGDSPASSLAGTPRRGASTPVGPPGEFGARRVTGGETSAALPSRLEDDQESIEDRNARLRVSAMGVLKWVFDAYLPTAPLVPLIHELLSSPTYWTVLHHAVHPPFYHQPLESSEMPESPFFGVIAGFGVGQTSVRRAGWHVVNALVGGHGEEGVRWREYLSGTDSPIELISSAILRSAFVEPHPLVRSSMWGPLLVFLTKFNQAWMHNVKFEHSSSSDTQSAGNGDNSDSESSGSEGEINDSPPQPHPAVQSPSNSAAYTELLAFLTLACNGSPIQGYPTILVILSTIPQEILAPTLPTLSAFFDALWAAIDGQALSTLAAERAQGTEAFMGAWGECLVWTVGKLVKSAPESNIVSENVGELRDDTSFATVSCALVRAQFGKLVRELGQGLKAEANMVGRKVAAVLGNLEAVEQDLFKDGWTYVSKFVRDAIAISEYQRHGEYAFFVLAALHKHLSPERSSKREVEQLVAAMATEIVDRCLEWDDRIRAPLPQDTAKQDSDYDLLTRDGTVLEKMLASFGSVLDRQEDFVQRLDSLLETKITSLFYQPSLILVYLRHRSDAARTLTVWHAILSSLGSPTAVTIETRIHVLGVLLDATTLNGIPSTAEPRGELAELTGHVLKQALGGDAASLGLVEKLLKKPDSFLDRRVVENMISTILDTIQLHTQHLIRDPSWPLNTLRSSLGLLLSLEQDTSVAAHLSSSLTNVMPGVFVLAFVLTHCYPSEEERLVSDLAKQMWDTWRKNTDEEPSRVVCDEVKVVLKALIMDTDVRPRPANILQAVPQINPRTEPRFMDFIPTHSQLDAMLSATSCDPIDSSLAIIEPLAPPSLNVHATTKTSWNRDFDSSGFSPYARGVSALLRVFTTDRQAARDNMWALHHALILALFASEMLQVPGAESPVFGSSSKVGESELKEISRQAQQTAAFLLTSPGEEWHKDVVDTLSGGRRSVSLDSMGEFVRLVFEHSHAHDTVRDSLVLHTVLQHVLRSATKGDADLWIDLSRALESQSLQTSLAISLAVTEFAPEPPKLDRYRNELASKLAGVPACKANTTGLRLLRCLCAVAPNPDSDVIFLPQQRAVYLVQALQAWMGSDEDLDEDLESETTLVLFTLAPILQNIQGAHWDFTIDLIESNIENSSFKDEKSLVLLSRTLRLLTMVQDLAVSNKYLRELWGQRSKPILMLVRDLLTAKIGRLTPSVPRAMCREQALSIIQDLPGSLMDESTLSTMCHLVTDPSVEVQKMAYPLLQHAASKRTEHLVVEAGVDFENTATIELPAELLTLLQSPIYLEIDPSTGGQEPFAYLLGWMAAFDLFTDASLKVKTAYVDQLRELDVIGGYFLPNIFEILEVGGDGQRPVKLDAWAVDEYWVSLYDPGEAQSLKLFAAHVYYRALLTVPSLVRAWWVELKDRQRSTAVTTFTAAYFSPVLIAAELAHVRPGAGEEPLADDSFSVRVALATNEVSARYSVDDQQMEIGVRVPPEYPLRAVEVRDVRRVGVPENLWRKWLFAVRLVVTSQNGRIVDGLGLFKRNVGLHFEGQVECAICYSIISVVDRSLPTKPCKTCKNRFHSGCLYKWLNTSHSSTCPLCRSQIL